MEGTINEIADMFRQSGLQGGRGRDKRDDHGEEVAHERPLICQDQVPSHGEQPYDDSSSDDGTHVKNPNPRFSTKSLIRRVEIKC